MWQKRSSRGTCQKWQLYSELLITMAFSIFVVTGCGYTLTMMLDTLLMLSQKLGENALTFLI
ncbi:hypothetical protein GIB67_000890 [Kingdonia uniflora]|uniref:Uncharacterized protein n=1 Tax=Kingdonia uniflora TaxID=39325 RepID=A0A7J7MDC8_9MAGN|nr:hypothetical protein GIB67_000890 [Kingdonia uniflora]